MTIHQIINEGSGSSLGPVEITKTYPPTMAGKSPKRFLLVKDGTGSSALIIWGPAANGDFNAGQSITLIGKGRDGGLKNQEYQGKWSINANDCEVTISGSGTPNQATQPYRPPQARQTSPGGAYQAPSGPELDIEGLSDRFVELAARTYEKAADANLIPEVCIGLAINSPTHAAQWFHGQKYPKRPGE